MTNDKIEEYRGFAESIDPEDLPREDRYDVIAMGPGIGVRTIREGIIGRYHAQYIVDRLTEAKGYAGVTFSYEPMTEDKG